MYLRKFGYPSECVLCSKKFITNHIKSIFKEKNEQIIEEFNSRFPGPFPYYDGPMAHELIQKNLKNKGLIDIYSQEKINTQNKTLDALKENKEYLSNPKTAYVFMIFCNSYDPFAKGWDWEEKEVIKKEKTIIRKRIEYFLKPKRNNEVVSNVINLFKKSNEIVFFIDNAGEDVALLNLVDILDKEIIIKAQHPHFNLWNDSNTNDVKRVLKKFNLKNEIEIMPVDSFFYNPEIFSETKCDLTHINGILRNMWYIQVLEEINLDSTVVGSFLPKCRKMREYLKIKKVRPIIYYSKKSSRKVTCNLQ